MSMWDDRYREPGFAYGTEPNDFLAAEAHRIPPGHWDGIVSISAHLPPLVRARIHGQVVAGLRPRGVFILEAYTERQLDIGGVGGPPAAQREPFMSLDALRRDLAGLSFVVGREIERDVNEGRYHKGRAAVVQCVAARDSQ